MGIIIDLVIIGIIVLSTFLAYKKGLVSLAIQLCSFIIAIVLTVILYQPISNLVINTTGIDEMIENTIYKKANNIMQDNENELASQLIETAKNEMLPETARNLAINIVRGGVIIVLVIAVRIALRFVNVIANIVAKLPIIDQINRAGGMVYGALRGILLIYVILLIVNICGQINPDNTVNKSVEESYLGKVMYQNNILNVLFK